MIKRRAKKLLNPPVNFSILKMVQGLYKRLMPPPFFAYAYADFRAAVE